MILRLGIIEFKPDKITENGMNFTAPKSAYPGTSVFAVSLNGQQFTKQPAVSDMEKEFTYDYYDPPYTTNYYPGKGPTNGANY